MKKYIAEFIGTFFLVVFGCGLKGIDGFTPTIFANMFYPCVT